MRNFALLFVIAQLAMSAICAHAARGDSVEIKSGFLTGNSYKELSDASKSGYVMGYIDGVFIAPAYGAPKRNTLPIERCVVGMANAQITAIIGKWLAENPARWHEQMNLLSFAALRSACPG